jgi:hypothetical protein
MTHSFDAIFFMKTIPTNSWVSRLSQRALTGTENMNITFANRRARCALLVSAAAAVVASQALLGVVNSNGAQTASPPYQVNAKITEPRIFGEGVISTPNDEIGGGFSPDGSEFYFSQFVAYTTLPRIGILCVSRYHDGRWATPEVLSFSGGSLDYPPRLDASGQHMFFASSRPLPDGTRGAIRIWEVARTAAGWGEPQPLPASINKPGSYWNGDPSVSADGTLYFSSDRAGNGNLHIFRSRFSNGQYSEPEKLGPEINSEFTDYQPYISSDGKTLLFSSVGSQEPPFRHRPEEITGGGRPYARGDLYVSVNQNGKWTAARHLAHNINTEAEEEFPFLSPDGKYLFFSSERSAFTVPVGKRLDYDRLTQQLDSVYNGHGNVFFVDVTALDLRK